MASDVASADPRSKLHSLVRLSGPFLGADLPLAERRTQVLSRMPLAAPARSAARPGRDRARRYACPGWATSIVENSDAKSPIEMNSSSVTVRRRGAGLRCRPIGQQRSCLRRSVESALSPSIVMMPGPASRACTALQSRTTRANRPISHRTLRAGPAVAARLANPERYG